MYLRIAEPQIRTALRDTRVVAISGPRQSGKTTLARRFAKQGRKFITLERAAKILDALNVRLRTQVAIDPLPPFPIAQAS